MVLKLTGCFLALHLADASDLRQDKFFLSGPSSSRAWALTTLCFTTAKQPCMLSAE